MDSKNSKIKMLTYALLAATIIPVGGTIASEVLAKEETKSQYTFNYEKIEEINRLEEKFNLRKERLQQEKTIEARNIINSKLRNNELALGRFNEIMKELEEKRTEEDNNKRKIQEEALRILEAERKRNEEKVQQAKKEVVSANKANVTNKVEKKEEVKREPVVEKKPVQKEEPKKEEAKDEVVEKPVEEKPVQPEKPAKPANATAGQAFNYIVAEKGLSQSEIDGWASIIQRESGWKINATNPYSGAYGLPQAKPASKMASHGADWKTNPFTQLYWMYDYMVGRYGSIQGAVNFWNANHWY